MSLNLELQDTENIDIDWVCLILEARDIGLTVEEVRAFLLNGTK